MTIRQDDVVLITGAGGGIGSALARRLGEAGCRLVLHSDSPEGPEKLVADEGWPPGRVLTAAHDIGDAEAVTAAVREAVDRFGRIDHLLNAAGVVFHGGVLTTDDEVWERTLRTNLTGTFLMARAVMPYMKEAGSGHIVAMSSVWGRRPSPPGAMLAYSVSKFGVEGLMDGLRAEAGPWGVKVTSLVIDKVDTPFRDRMAPHVVYGPEQRARMIEACDVAEATYAVLDSSARVLPGRVELDAWLWE